MHLRSDKALHEMVRPPSNIPYSPNPLNNSQNAGEQPVRSTIEDVVVSIRFPNITIIHQE